MAGRPPKPTTIKKLTGNAGHRPLNEAEPQFEPGVPQPPDFLDEVALEEWHRIIPELQACNLLTLADRAALVAYCHAYAGFVESVEGLKKEGRVIKTGSGYMQPHPYVAMEMKYLGLMHKFLVEFGLSPSSRTRLKVEPPKEEDEFDKRSKIRRIS